MSGFGYYLDSPAGLALPENQAGNARQTGCGGLVFCHSN